MYVLSRYEWRQGYRHGDREGRGARDISRGPEEAVQELCADPAGPAAEGRRLGAGADHRQADRGAARRPDRSHIRSRSGQPVLLRHSVPGQAIINRVP